MREKKIKMLKRRGFRLLDKQKGGFRLLDKGFRLLEGEGLGC